MTVTPSPRPSTDSNVHALCAVSRTAPPSAPVQAAVTRLEAAYGAQISIAWLNPDGSTSNIGSLLTGPAWSTSKLPLAVAIQRAGIANAYSEELNAAITNSDNDSAAVLWRALGSNETAAAALTAVLNDLGSTTTTVPATVTYPGFSIAGQTQWSTAEQVLFLDKLSCSPEAVPTLERMGAISPTQAWGLGRFAGARYKGGWGPGKNGGYWARQLGYLPQTDGSVQIVAILVWASGSFDSATAILTELSTKLS